MDWIEWLSGYIFGRRIVDELEENISPEESIIEDTAIPEDSIEDTAIPEEDTPPDEHLIEALEAPSKNPLHRPQGWNTFISRSNQDTVDRLKMAIAAAKKENRILPHILLFGGPGRGKTTLAKILASEMGCVFKETVGSAISKQADLYTLFVELEQLSEAGKPVILFIDEIHDIARKDAPETLWYPILEEFCFYHNLKESMIMIDGDKYRVTQSQARLTPFTIVGATTDPGMLSAPLRDRFPIQCYLNAYTVKDLRDILLGYAKRAGIKLFEKAALELAKRGRGTPRTAISLVTACHDRAVLKDSGITSEIVTEQMDSQRIDEEGLTDLDIRILKVLSLAHPKGLGLSNLAGSSGLNKSTISEMIEPLLKQRGYMITTSRRFITNAGEELLKKKGVL